MRGKKTKIGIFAIASVLLLSQPAYGNNAKLEDKLGDEQKKEQPYARRLFSYFNGTTKMYVDGEVIEEKNEGYLVQRIMPNQLLSLRGLTMYNGFNLMLYGGKNRDNKYEGETVFFGAGYAPAVSTNRNRWELFMSPALDGILGTTSERSYRQETIYGINGGVQGGVIFRFDDDKRVQLGFVYRHSLLTNTHLDKMEIKSISLGLVF